MNLTRLTNLTSTEIDQIATFLSTPRHGSLSAVTTTSFGNTPIGLLPRKTLSFTLTNDGLDTLTPAGTTTTPTGFQIGGAGCSSALAVSSTCTVVVEFRPVSAIAYSTSFTIPHDGYLSGSSSGTITGQGQLNLEITTAGPLPFNTPFTNPASTPDTKTVSFANRLNQTLRLCLADTTPSGTAVSAPADFGLVGRTFDPSPPAPSQCVAVAGAGLTPSQVISFAPTASNPRVAQFTVERDAGGGTWTDKQSIGLEGNAGPLAIFSGSALNGAGTALFEAVKQDTSLGAVTAQVTMTNAGAHPLQVVGVSAPLVAGAATAEYGVTGCGSVTLNSGQSCTLTVSFDPLEVGLRSGQLRIDYVDASATTPPTQSSVLALLGRGFVGPQLEVRDALGVVTASNALVDFGRQNINVNYLRRFTLRNIGTEEALVLSSAALVPSSSAFSLVAPAVGAGSPPACSTLAAGTTQRRPGGESCVIDIRFAPTQELAYSSQLSIHTQPETSATPLPGDYRLTLNGQGANDIPVLLWRDLAGNSISTVSFPLPATAVGSASPPTIKIRLANSGKGAATLKLLNVVGADAANFALDLSDPGACAAGEQAQAFQEGTTCDVVIRFTPQTAGNKQANLQLVSTGSTPQPIMITAQAAGPAGGVDVAVAPATIDFTEVRVGAESAPATITITNNGTFPAVVTGIEADQPFTVLATTCAGMSFTLAPNASCTMAVRFLPKIDGQMAGALRVSVDGRATPAAASLRGDGVKAADLSSGGCSLLEGRSSTDPTLWLLALSAIVALLYRRDQRRRTRLRRPSDRQAP